MESVRVDKWLWAARFFKTRELAAKACEMGRISSNNVRAKPAREVHIGDRLNIRNEAVEWEIDVRGLSKQRGPATASQALYRETEASADLRRKATEERRLVAPALAAPTGRPSKRDRRLIHSFTGKF
jgi:ribosome-associated heat shock protein Hsp15